MSRRYVSWRRVRATAAPFKSSSDGNFSCSLCAVMLSMKSVIKIGDVLVEFSKMSKLFLFKFKFFFEIFFRCFRDFQKNNSFAKFVILL